MRLLVLSARDVHALLSYRECADVMRDALAALASGRAQQPLRTVISPAGAAGMMALMPSYLAAAGPPGEAGRLSEAGVLGDAVYGLKAICITPANPAHGLDTPASPARARLVRSCRICQACS